MRRGALWLALVAVLLKAAVPAGYMLTADAERKLLVALCSASSTPLQAVLDLGPDPDRQSGGDHDEKTASEHLGLCPFAVAAGAAPPPGASPPPAPRLLVLVDDRRPASAAWSPAAATGPPLPARGPPLIA
jgi:hypothetical protein